MGEFRLSQQSQEQLRGIAGFSASRFGLYQAEAYLSGLERTFQLLADFPGMGVDVGNLIAGVRRFRFQSHLIFYSQSDGFILIRAVFHASQDVRKELFE